MGSPAQPATLRYLTLCSRAKMRVDLGGGLGLKDAPAPAKRQWKVSVRGVLGTSKILRFALYEAQRAYVKGPRSQCFHVFLPLHLLFFARVSRQLMIAVALLSCRCRIIHPLPDLVFRTLRLIGHYLPHSISPLLCGTLEISIILCPEKRSLVLRAATFENAVSSANENFWLPSRHNCFHHFLPHRTFNCFLYLAANAPFRKPTQNPLYYQR